MVGDIKRWHRDLDRVKYADVFIENEVGLHDLPHITEDDLRPVSLYNRTYLSPRQENDDGFERGIIGGGPGSRGPH